MTVVEASEPKPAEETKSEKPMDRAPRRRVLKGVKVGFGDNFCAVEGVMRNLSETGAFLEFTDGLLIPDSIVIYNEMDGYKRECIVVRREANRLGVKFVSEEQEIQTTKHQVVKMINMDRGPSQPEPQQVVPQHSSQQAVQQSEAPQPCVTRPARAAPSKPVFGKRGR